ncbi:SusC/RagA family TonB-linked outer membrane protein [Flavobacteriaceae bacterium M23B6Z8]
MKNFTKCISVKKGASILMINMVFFLLSFAGLAQDRTITGQVTTNGNPLPGVNVVVKGTSIGQNTDFDGNYTIQVPENSNTLVFSYVGFNTQEITIGDQTVINVSMTENVTALEDVVVIGYGTRKREDLIGAVSAVKAEAIQRQQVNTFQEALIGQVSGVQFRQNGAPDGGPEVVIRGVASLGNNTPLYVVDGFPLGNSAAIASQRDNFILSAINPDDIESISVLKDASAKAIYGSRASNGVVIITTKQGQAGKSTFSFTSRVGIQSIPEFEKPDVLNARELYQYQLDFYDDKEADGLPLGGLQRNQRAFLLGLAPEDIGPDNDWFDLISRDAFVKDYNVSVRGGSETVKYFVSAALQNREGTLINTDSRRYTINANVDIDIKDNLRLALNFAPTRTIATGGRTDGGAGNFQVYNAVTLAAWTDPTAPLFDEDGELTGVTQGKLIYRARNLNPVTLLTEREDRRRTNQMRTSMALEWDLLPNLTFKTSGLLQYTDRRNNNFTPSRFPGNSLNPSFLGTQQASASVFTQNQFNWVFANTLEYRKVFNEKHDVDVFLGYTLEKRRATSTRVSSSNLADEDIRLPSASNSVEPTDFTGNASTDSNALISYIGRVNYAFDNRYYITGTVRTDGSSRFGAGNRYATFPSVAAAWRISNESFFEGLRGTISDLKIEGGYGTSGNNGLGNYQAQGSITPGQDYVFGGSNAPGVDVNGLPNLNARWEETQETNFGIDLGLFKNRLYLSADYYNINSVDFLAFRPLPNTSGFDGVIDNTGEINNKGFEIELKWDIFRKQDFRWTANFNYSQNRNEVVDLIQEEGFLFPNGSNIAGINFTEVREGQPIGLFRGLKVTGLFTQEDIDDPNVAKYPGAIVGSLKFEDQLTVDTDGDGVPDQADGRLNNQDVTIIGDSNPDFVFGFSTQLNYKDFDFSVTLDGQVGADIFYAQTQVLFNQNDGQFNVDRTLLQRYRPGDDPTTKKIPGVGSNNSQQFLRRPNSLNVHNSDYLWIRNITMGYTFKGKDFEKYFSSLRLFASIQNPILFTNYEYGSPTVNRAGDNSLVRNVDYGAYPIARTLTFGLNATF